MKRNVRTIIAATIILAFGAGTVIFGVLYAEATDIEFIRRHKTLFEIFLFSAVFAVSVVAFVFQLSSKDFIFRFSILFLGFSALALAVLYALKVTGFFDKIDSIDDFREFVASYGAVTVPIFILIQFLQVVILPIPGFITIGAGVALFGPFYGSLYSIIGILSASIAAFFIGRVLGYRVAGWLVGKETLDKWSVAVKGKDKIILTFMFLFPFFPDDVLCFVAGLSSMSVPYYLVMITITRVLNIVVSSYSIEGALIPYTTWWGILIWSILFVVTAVICFLIYKYGDKIENRLKSVFGRKKAVKDPADGEKNGE